MPRCSRKTLAYRGQAARGAVRAHLVGSILSEILECSHLALRAVTQLHLVWNHFQEGPPRPLQRRGLCACLLREVPRRSGKTVGRVGHAQRPPRGRLATRQRQLPDVRQVLLQPGLPGQDTEKACVSLCLK